LDVKQILQSIKTGVTQLADVPVPAFDDNSVLIQTRRTLISAGTERMLVEFGRAGLVEKARQQPDKVRMVLDKVKSDGLLPTIDAVTSKLDQPLALGYSNVGTVVEVGANIRDLSVGDRVVSNGAHAEFITAPRNLCARIPEEVSDDQAAFTVLASIGLQGIRLADIKIGESVVVIGLGLIGLLTVQLLRAHGCRVLGLDMNAERAKLARSFGADAVDLSAGKDPLAIAAEFSRGRGVDAVLITASTESNAPVEQAARMSRQRGRIVLVGVSGLELSRAHFYEKELSFQVSCSYGPGRYDPEYEEGGHDYPFGLVRWTEQRNFEAILDLMASEALDTDALVSHRFPVDDALKAYELLGSAQSSLGIILEFGGADRQVAAAQAVVELDSGAERSTGGKGISVIGAGNYAGRVLIPALARTGAELCTLVSQGGVSSVHYGKKFGFADAATDAVAAIEDDASAIVIASRHDTHAEYVIKAVEAGKHVFVEKPLCLTRDELREIELTMARNPSRILMVGFNRRFSPLIAETVGLLAGVPGPKSFVMTVNAGSVPADHWTQDLAVGGGRVIGEGCHFIDLLRYLADSTIDSVDVATLRHKEDAKRPRDTVSIQLGFANGSLGIVHYFAEGHKSYPKERLECFASGRVLQLDNFRQLRTWGWPGSGRKRLWRQNKGQEACISAFINAVRTGGASPIPLDQVIEVSRVSIDAQESIT
jgi:predicted dehydrogenase